MEPATFENSLRILIQRYNGQSCHKQCGAANWVWRANRYRTKSADHKHKTLHLYKQSKF